MATTDSNVTIYPFYTCHEVTPFCPIEATTLGYYPNEGVNIFLAIGFGAAALATTVVGVWKRTWGFFAFVTAGCLLELAGYAARVTLHDNPWDAQAFETQICAIILGPTLICISIYLTLKHICLALNPSLSRVRPAWYPFVFVPLDVSCLCIQAIGGALAASATQNRVPDEKMLAGGNHAIIAGIALQVVVLLGFGSVSADYLVRVARWMKKPEAEPRAVALWKERRFRMFLGAVIGAYSGILIRCIYRIAEMAGGWGNPIMRDQPSFVVLEGFMILIPCFLLAGFPPGFLFPQMAAHRSSKAKKGKTSAASETNGDKSAEQANGTGKHLGQDPEKQVAGHGVEPTLEDDEGGHVQQAAKQETDG